MNDWSPTEECAIAHRLLRTEDAGVLSTISTEIAGYPFGSVTPYVMTHEGEIAVYVSGIAQHTANMEASSRVCLTVLEQGGGDQQALGRVTVVGDAELVPAESEERVAERYFRFYPAARAYAGTHPFSFYWIRPKRVRYIGGFGRIFWIESEDWSAPSPAWSEHEQGIIDHMNSDHADFVGKLAERCGMLEAAEAKFVACDPEGFHIRAGDSIRYVPFQAPAMTAEAIRAAIIEAG